MPAVPARVVPRRFYAGNALDVAPLLLNKVLVHGRRAARIVEVEAYRGEEDPASHAYRGPTRRNATMFGPPGRLYVYFTYGMHWCANAVCGSEGVAQAVLLRALAPLRGVEEMRQARAVGGGSGTRQLASGPAKLCQAMGITGADDGADLVKGDRGLRIVDDGTPAPDVPGVGKRIGISRAAELPWRFWVPGDENVSRTRLVPGSARGAGHSQGRL
ncbi:MAG: DNA-3-methyladenine glycosylase [Acidimicrobiales bacterium]